MHIYDMASNSTERITDGVYVGVPDWVYEGVYNVCTCSMCVYSVCVYSVCVCSM